MTKIPFLSCFSALFVWLSLCCNLLFWLWLKGGWQFVWLGGLPFPFSSLFWAEKTWRVAVFFPLGAAFRLGRHRVGCIQFEFEFKLFHLLLYVFQASLQGWTSRYVIVCFSPWAFRCSIPWSPCAVLWACGLAGLFFSAPFSGLVDGLRLGFFFGLSSAFSLLGWSLFGLGFLGGFVVL